MKKIKLTMGKFALVDDDMFEWLDKWRWSYKKDGGYAVRNGRIRLKDGKYKTKRIWMHRLINNTPDDMITDHINRITLDNRRCNLRTADKSLNGLNRDKPKSNTSGYKGVHFDKQTNKWRAEIRLNNKNFKLGRFTDIQDAVKARLKAEQKYYEKI